MRQCVARTRNRHGGAPEASPLSSGARRLVWCPACRSWHAIRVRTRHPGVCRRSSTPLIGGGGNDEMRPRSEAGETRKEKWNAEVEDRKRAKRRVRGNSGRKRPGKRETALFDIVNRKTRPPGCEPHRGIAALSASSARMRSRAGEQAVNISHEREFALLLAVRLKDARKLG